MPREKQRLVRREALDRAVIRLRHRRAFGGEGAHGRGLDGVRLHVAHDAQEHVRGRVKGRWQSVSISGVICAMLSTVPTTLSRTAQFS